MADEDPSERLIEGWLQDRRSLDVEAYVKRGRRYINADTAALKERWVELQREFFRSDRTNEIERTDIQAELDLRNEQLPLEALKAEHAEFMARVQKFLEHQKIHDPERFEEFGQGLLDDLEDFQRQLKKPSA